MYKQPSWTSLLGIYPIKARHKLLPGSLGGIGKDSGQFSPQTDYVNFYQQDSKILLPASLQRFSLTKVLISHILNLSRKLFQIFVAPRYATKIWPGSNVCRYSIYDSQMIEFKCSPVPAGMGLFLGGYMNGCSGLSLSHHRQTSSRQSITQKSKSIINATP